MVPTGKSLQDSQRKPRVPTTVPRALAGIPGCQVLSQGLGAVDLQAPVLAQGHCRLLPLVGEQNEQAGLVAGSRSASGCGRDVRRGWPLSSPIGRVSQGEGGGR